MALSQNQPTDMLRALLHAPIWLYRWNLGLMMSGYFSLLTSTGYISGLVTVIFSERLLPDKETCFKTTDSIPLISLTPIG